MPVGTLCVAPHQFVCTLYHYRPHPKDGEGNVFTLSTPGGGGVRPSRPGGGCQVSQLIRGGGVRSSWRGGGGGFQVQPAGGGSGQSADRGGGVSILRPLAGGMPLAFTQEDFLVFKVFLMDRWVVPRKKIRCEFVSSKVWGTSFWVGGWSQGKKILVRICIKPNLVLSDFCKSPPASNQPTNQTHECTDTKVIRPVAPLIEAAQPELFKVISCVEKARFFLGLT